MMERTNKMKMDIRLEIHMRKRLNKLIRFWMPGQKQKKKLKKKIRKMSQKEKKNQSKKKDRMERKSLE
jgi:hypothetical protein